MEERPKANVQKYAYEIAFFLSMLLLTVANEWIVLNSFNYFFSPLAFFLIIYLQAQLFRFIAMPLLIQEKYLRFITVVAFYVLVVALVFYVANRFWPAQDFHHGQRKSVKFIIYHTAVCIISTIILMALSLTRQYYQEAENRTSNQLLLSEMNIRLLHAQLSPHFFFNMFNNLYGVSLTDPKRMPDLILQLSHLMRYPLENGSRPSVSIREEIDFIQAFVNIEKERNGERCEVLLLIPEDRELLSRYRIAPLILATLVENAFKHSAGSSGDWFVKIYFELTGDELMLVISNSVPTVPPKKESIGIGLSNVRRRLELLYPQQYSFEASKYPWEFKTVLTIKLKALWP